MISFLKYHTVEMSGDVVRFPNCIVYSWVYNTQKTVKFFFDCFHSLHQAMHWYVSIRIGIFRVSSPGSNWKKLFFIHTVRSYSHSTATAEFVKATAGFVMSSEASDQLYFSHFSTFRFVLGNIWLFSCVILTNTVEKVRNPSHFFKPIEVTNSAVAVEWL